MLHRISRFSPATSALLVLTVLLTCGGAMAGTGERLLTLDIRERPLKEVLQRLSGHTGYTFIFDTAWGGHPVSATFKNVPLHTGLRQILGNWSHALVFLPAKKIKIIILERSGAVGSGADAPRGPGFGRTPQTVNPAGARGPEPPAPAEYSNLPRESGDNETTGQPQAN
jgi:hypothetical protein